MPDQDIKQWEFNLVSLGFTEFHLTQLYGDNQSNWDVTVTIGDGYGLISPLIEIGHGPNKHTFRLNQTSADIPLDDPQRLKYLENVKARLIKTVIRDAGWYEPRIARVVKDISDDFVEHGYRDNGRGLQLPVTLGIERKESYINCVTYIAGWIDSEDGDSVEYNLDQGCLTYVPDWTRENFARFLKIAQTYLSRITGSKNIQAVYGLSDKNAPSPDRRYVVYVEDPDSIYHRQAVGYSFNGSQHFDLYRATINPGFRKSLEMLEV